MTGLRLPVSEHDAADSLSGKLLYRCRMLPGNRLVVVPVEAEFQGVPVVIATFCLRSDLVHVETHDGVLARFCFTCQSCINETLTDLIAQ